MFFAYMGPNRHVPCTVGAGVGCGFFMAEPAPSGISPLSVESSNQDGPVDQNAYGLVGGLLRYLRER